MQLKSLLFRPTRYPFIMSLASERRVHLAAQPELLRAIRRGIEKEGLRVDASGNLAATPHPPALGSALTNPRITTDYSESLLELITRPLPDADALVAELTDIHSFVRSEEHTSELQS